jgi:DNA-binding response OmpR family regulator
MSPRGEAFLLYRWLREIPELRELPVLVIDCPVEKPLIKGWRTDERLMLGSEDYLERPVEPKLLVRRIEKLLDRKTKRIRVLVATDHKIVREGIIALLALESEMQVVG